MGRGGCAGEDGLTSLAEAGQIRLVVIALASCCAHCQHLRTGVPTVRALLGKGMQLLRKNMRRSPADVLLHLRQSEKKFVCRERYTQLREGGGQSLSSIVAFS